MDSATSPPQHFLDWYADPHHAAMDWRLGYGPVRRLAGELAGRTVLDYGCGDGKFSRVLRDGGARVVGVDTDAAAIASARGRDGDGIRYRHIDSGDLCFIDDAGIDLAVSTFVLCCVRGPDALARIAQEIARVLPSGGTWTLAEPHPDAAGHAFVSMRRVVRGGGESGAPVDVHVDGAVAYHDFYHTRADHLDALAAGGFVIEQMLEPTVDPASGEGFWRDERSQPPFLILHARRSR